MNVKAGDLAIVVDDGGKFENLGLIVKVVSFEGKIKWDEFGSQQSWLIKAVGVRGLCYQRNDGRLYFKRNGKMPDCCLKRIEPDLNSDDLFHAEALDDTLPASLFLPLRASRSENIVAFVQACA